ncbi:MAG: NAD(P)-dependent oxidoreductase [Mariprofundales bacterium]|nr:NAD(P)-dependent oxidoreductase [Mariprofundales bacterium]
MLPLRIVVDGNISHAVSAFGALPGLAVTLDIAEPVEITPQRVRSADVLLVRSSTKVNGKLLDGSRVRFVATATVGDDHIDRSDLAQRGIVFASAAGSSTDSVVEYVTAALFALQHDHAMALPQLTIGVVGVGRIGSKVARLSQRIGMGLLCNDPPRAAQGDAEFAWQPLDRLLAESDILTLHTPLLHDGAQATLHLLNAENLAHFHGRVVINAGRGAVVDNAALLQWLNGAPDRLAVLDCWEHEPQIDRALLAHPQVVVATPHIAGHSLDGKAANTQAVYDALCRFLGVDGAWNMNDELPVVPSLRWPLLAADAVMGKNRWAEVTAMITQLYPLANDTEACRELLKNAHSEDYAAAFKKMRRHYPVRRGWDRTQFQLQPYDAEVADLARRVGLKIANP